MMLPVELNGTCISDRVRLLALGRASLFTLADTDCLRPGGKCSAIPAKNISTPVLWIILLY